MLAPPEGCSLLCHRLYHPYLVTVRQLSGNPKDGQTHWLSVAVRFVKRNFDTPAHRRSDHSVSFVSNHGPLVVEALLSLLLLYCIGIVK